MKFTSLSSSAQVAYADLLTNLHTAAIPARGVSCFTRKIKGKTYWYVQPQCKAAPVAGADSGRQADCTARYGVFRRYEYPCPLAKGAA